MEGGGGGTREYAQTCDVTRQTRAEWGLFIAVDPYVLKVLGRDSDVRSPHGDPDGGEKSENLCFYQKAAFTLLYYFV